MVLVPLDAGGGLGRAAEADGLDGELAALAASTLALESDATLAAPSTASTGVQPPVAVEIPGAPTGVDQFVDVDGLAMFVVDGALWVSDGTGEGTRELDLPEGRSAWLGRTAWSQGRTSAVADGRLYFTVGEQDLSRRNDPELWVSDGSQEGTFRLGLNDTYTFDVIDDMAAFGSRVGVRATERLEGDETRRGLYLLEDDGADASYLGNATRSTYPPALAVVDDRLYVGGPDGLDVVDQNGERTQVWGFDRDSGVRPGPQWLTAVGDKVFFRARERDGVDRVYASDGVPGGETVAVTPLNEIERDWINRPFVAVGDQLFFFAGARSRTGNLVSRLWVSDGTPDGTEEVWPDEFYAGFPTNDEPEEVELMAAGDRLVFPGRLAESHWWTSSGRVEETSALSLDDELIPAGFTGIGASTEAYAWIMRSSDSALVRTDGTSEGTVVVRAAEDPDVPLRVRGGGLFPIGSVGDVPIFEGVQSETRFGDRGLWRMDVGAPSWPEDASLRVDDVGTSSASISWDPAAPSSADITGYRVLVDGAFAQRSEGVATSMLLEGLDPGVSVTVTVEAVAGFGAIATGPSAEITTGTQVDPGTAPLTATAVPGAVSLGWEGRADVDGYRVYRAMGVDDLTLHANVDASVTSYLDEGVDAGTDYRYEVRAVVSSDEVAHTVEAGVTTLGLTIGATDTSSLSIVPDVAPLGSDLGITVDADPYRTATATVGTREWVEGADTPQERTRELELLPSSDLSTYRATLELAEGIAGVDSVEVELCDAAGTCTTDLLDDVGLTVGGELEIDLGLAADERSLDGGRVTLTSDTVRGASAPLSVDGTARVTRLVPSTDARVRVTDGSGWDAAERLTLDVEPGRVLRPSFEAALRASRDFEVVDQDGRPAVGAELRLFNRDGGFLGQRRTGEDGITSERVALLRAQEIVVEVSGLDGRLSPGTWRQTISIERDEPVVTLVVPNLPVAEISGNVTYADEAPAEGARVTASKHIDGTDWTFEATVDADGHYQLTALVGDTVRVTAAAQEQRQVATIELPAEGRSGVDLPLRRIRGGQVAVSLTTRAVGEDVRGPFAGGNPAYSGGARVTIDGRLLVGDQMWVYREGGTDVEVCADGTRISMPTECTTVVIDEDEPVTAELALEQVAVVMGTVRDAENSRPSWFPKIIRLTDEGSERIGQRRRADSSFEIALDEPGTYEFSAVSGSRRTPVRSFDVAEGAIVDIGDLELREPGVFADSRVTAAVDEAAAGDTVPFRVHLRHDGLEQVEDAVVMLDVPADATLLPGGVVVDGVPLAAEQVERHDGGWAVAIGDVAPGERLGIRARLTVDDDVASGATVALGASLVGELPTGSLQEPFGSAGVVVTGVTIEAPDVTATHEVVLTGRAPAGEAVTLFDGESPIGVAIANPGGRYRAEVVLIDRGDRFGHVVRAEVGDPAELDRSSRRVVRYEPGYPVPVESSLTVAFGTPFSVGTLRRTYEFDPRDGIARFPSPFALPMTAQVRVGFDDPAGRVTAATASVGGISAPLVLGDDGIYQARISVDTSIGGAVLLDYDVAPGALDIDREIAWRSDPAIVRNRLPLRLSDFDLTGTGTTLAGTETSRTTDASMLIDSDGALVLASTGAGAGSEGDPEDFDDSGESYDQAWSVQSSGSVSGVAQDIDASLGLEWVDYDIAQELAPGAAPIHDFNVAWSLTSNALTISASGVIPEDVLPEGEPAAAAAALVQTALTDGAFTFDSHGSLSGGEPLGDAEVRPARLIRGAKVTFRAALKGADAASTLADLKDALSGADRYQELEDQLDDIMERCNSPRSRDFFQERLDNIATETAVYQVGSSGLMLVGLVTGPLGLAAGAIIGEGFDQEIDRRLRNLRDDMDVDTDCEEEEKEREDEESEDDDPPPGPPGGPGDLPAGSPIADVYWVHDPAGYVFEAVESNRLEGATVTVLEGDPADAAEQDIQGWTPWDAEWFGQVNPQVTGDDGRYAWDVPEGWWYTFAELDGYVPVSSEVLRVLPEHFDVHLGLVSLEAPQVTEVLAYEDAIEVGFDRWMRTDRVIDRIEVVDDEGDAVLGTWQPVDEQPHSLGRADLASADLVAPADEPLAEAFTFAPDQDLSVGETFTVSVDESVEAYNLRLLDEVFEQVVTVQARPVSDPDPDDGDGEPTPDTPTPDTPAPPPGSPTPDDPDARPDGFSDVVAGSTHGDAILAIAEAGIALGYPDGTFRPVELVSREQMASFLQRALDLPDGDRSAFSDVEGTHAAAIGAIAREGITIGYPDGTFRPRADVGRGHLAAMLARAADLEASRSAGFSDTAGTTHEAAIDAVAEVEIARGFDDGTFRPGEPVTRGQMASFLDRWLEHVG